MDERDRKRPLIVPFFISNQGCPHRCIYCRQETITGEGEAHLEPATVVETLKRAMESPKFTSEGKHEIAFYGGTFTGLSYDSIKGFLGATDGFIEDGSFDAVRVSTRPDSLEPKKLDFMWRHGVRTVELGVQSMNKEVLDKSRRGYSPEKVYEAVEELRRLGFRVGVQLMPGLPGDSHEKFLETTRKIVEIEPDMVRIYPTLVVKDTVLASLYRQGRYRPLELEEAEDLCATSCLLFEDKGIPVIRIGLQSSPSLEGEGAVVAGPWHPAFGFMVRTNIYHRMLAKLLPKGRRPKALRIRVNPRDIPMVRGHRNQKIHELKERVGVEHIDIIPDESLETYRPVVM